MSQRNNCIPSLARCARRALTALFDTPQDISAAMYYDQFYQIVPPFILGGRLATETMYLNSVVTWRVQERGECGGVRSCCSARGATEDEPKDVLVRRYRARA